MTILKPRAGRAVRPPSSKTQKVKIFIILLLLLIIGIGVTSIYLIIFNSSSWLNAPKTILFVDSANHSDDSPMVLVNFLPEVEQSQLYILRLPQDVTQAVSENPDYRFVTQQLGLFIDQVIVVDRPIPNRAGQVKWWLMLKALDRIIDHDEQFRFLLLSSWATQFNSPSNIDLVDAEQLEVRQKLQKQVQPLTVSSYQCPIMVSNATNISGIANSFAEFINAQGGVVVRVVNHADKSFNSTVIIDDSAGDCMGTAELIGHYLSVEPLVQKEANLFNKSRAKVEVRLGEEFNQFPSLQ